MRIRLSNKLQQLASALLVVMVLGGLLCLFVTYYLSLVEQQNKLSVRSQAWNIAMAVTEAGIEEGLAALNKPRSPGDPITLSSLDGWQQVGGYWWRTNVDASLGGNWYTIRVDLGNVLLPEIICRAYVGLPAMAAAAPDVLFAAYGVTTGPGVVTRAVRVRCQDTAMFVAAMVAKHKIDLKGNGVLTDSFNSASLWESNFGLYDANVYAGDRGDVASNDGIVGTIGVGNAEIYGKAHTGAEGSVTINNGWVGPHTNQVAGQYEPGWILPDANFTFPTNTIPYSSGLPLGGPETIVTVSYDYSRTSTNSALYPNPPPWSGVTTNFQTTSTTTSEPPAPGTYVGTIQTNYAGGSENLKTYTYKQILGTTYSYTLYYTNAVYVTNTYDHVLRDGAYYSTADLHGSTIVLGHATLVLPNGLSMSGNDAITIATGASLTNYVGGTTCTVGGNGIINESGYAGDNILYCADSVTTFNFNGNGTFIGVLVAPNADMSLNGAGHENTDFSGAVMANSITMNGHFSFHYDEALSALKNNPRLLIKSWDEIP
jgi:hypothetical protein